MAAVFGVGLLPSAYLIEFFLFVREMVPAVEGTEVALATASAQMAESRLVCSASVNIFEWKEVTAGWVSPGGVEDTLARVREASVRPLRGITNEVDAVLNVKWMPVDGLGRIREALPDLCHAASRRMFKDYCGVSEQSLSDRAEGEWDPTARARAEAAGQALMREDAVKLDALRQRLAEGLRIHREHKLLLEAICWADIAIMSAGFVCVLVFLRGAMGARATSER